VSNPLRQAERIRAAVRSRHGFASELDVPPPGETGAIEEAAGLSRVSAHWGLASSIPVVGPFIVLVQRVIRISLRWYINPIVDQQNAFNEAAVRALYELRAENDALRAQLAGEEERE
jgi:hypothetical protein